MENIEAKIKSDCAAQIFPIFPDICPDYFEKTATKYLYDVKKILEEILSDSSYSKKARPKSLKRKCESSEKDDEVSKLRRLYNSVNRPPETAPVYISISQKVLCQDFPRATTKSVAKFLKEHNNCLMQTYLDLDEIYRNWEGGKAQVGFIFKKTRTPPDLELEPANLDSTLDSLSSSDMKRTLEELRAARQVCAAELAKRNSVVAKILDEENNFRQAQEEGAVAECGCCFDERPLNRMVHCNNPDSKHYFCVDCARKSAETAIGFVKFELNCISMDGCSFKFSHSQKTIFLDEKLQAALDRIEFEAALQAQGFENLSACPFCPYAADCPPIEEDKEFRCINPECEIVSCRLCKTPFIKEAGCNKMTCTRPGCKNVQCYVCSESCDYSHFDDSSRGGKKGNCPLFEKTEVRHEKEVRKAEDDARQKIMAANPELNEKHLRFNTSKRVPGKQEKTRKSAQLRAAPREARR